MRREGVWVFPWLKGFALVFSSVAAFSPVMLSTGLPHRYRQNPERIREGTGELFCSCSRGQISMRSLLPCLVRREP